MQETLAAEERIQNLEEECSRLHVALEADHHEKAFLKKAIDAEQAKSRKFIRGLLQDKAALEVPPGPGHQIYFGHGDALHSVKQSGEQAAWRAFDRHGTMQASPPYWWEEKVQYLLCPWQAAAKEREKQDVAMAAEKAQLKAALGAALDQKATAEACLTSLRLKVSFGMPHHTLP